MSDIFISYSRKDIDLAGKIVKSLAEYDLDTWVDWKNIPKGEEWEDEIYRGIEAADAFLFLVSPDSTASEICRREIDHAVKNKKKILPLVIRDTKPETTHPEISKRNWVFCRAGQDDFDKAIKEIHKTIHTDYEWLRYHTKLQLKALEWKRTKDSNQLLRGKELQEAEQRLATAGSLKDPQPTDLQREFVAAGRQADRDRRRSNIRIAAAVAATISLLCVLAGIGGGVAYVQSQARATAQTVAEEQGNAASGRQLASQAQLLPLYGTSMITSGLLSVEAAHLNPGLQAQQALSRFSNSIGNPIARYSSEDMILSGSISSDGQLIATGDNSGNVNVWDIASGKETASVQHMSAVWSLAFSPTNTEIVSAGRDLSLWDAATGRTVFTKSSPAASYVHPLFSPGGTAIVTVLDQDNGNSSLVALDATSGSEIAHYDFDGNNALLSLSQEKPWAVVVQEFDNQRQLVQVIDWKRGTKISERSSDIAYNVESFALSGSQILSASGRSTIEIWDASNGNSIASADVCSSAIHSMAVSRDALRIAVGCDDGTLVILNAQDLSEIMLTKQNDFADHSTYDPMLELRFNGDGSRIVTGGTNGTAIVWDIDLKKEIARMPHDGPIRYVAYNPVQDWVISGGSELRVTVWKPETGLMEYQLIEENRVSGLSFNPNGDLLIATDGNDLQVWDTKDWKLVQSQKLSSPIFSPVVFSRDGSLMIAAGEDNNIRSFDVGSGKELAMVQHEDWVQAISLDSNNKSVISGSPAAGYLRWNPYSGEVTGYVDMTSQPPGLSPDGRWIGYVVDSDSPPRRDLIVEDLETGNKILTAQDGNDPIVFSPDNSVIAFTNFDFKTLHVWSIQGNREMFSAKHEGVITSISFSLDGKFLITVSRDAAIYVWETATGNEVAKLTLPSPVKAVAIRPDNRFIAFSYDSVVYNWSWRTSDLVDEVCYRLPRNLTQSEWDQYMGKNITYRATCPNLPLPAQ